MNRIRKKLKEKKRLLVLDQWASNTTEAGTSKNWLYHYFAEYYDCKIVNADSEFCMCVDKMRCLLKAAIVHPFNIRKEYHRAMEASSKYPVNFQRRSRRFEKVISKLSGQFDATFQIGGLFAPSNTSQGYNFSYHDQTVAIVEREWPEWLPRNFSRFREKFYALERKNLCAKSLIFTYSEYTRRSIIDDYGVSPEKIVVAPTACKIDYPRVKEVLKEREQKILFISTDFFRKGGDIVFAAFRRISQQRPEARLIIVGGKFDKPLPERALYKGILSHYALREELLKASIIVHPARHDAFPNVLKEAIACGVPVVASNCVGIPEIVSHGETGVIIKKNDPEVLAKVVLNILSNQAKLREMQRNCVLARERFRPERCAGRIITKMSEIMSSTVSE